MSLTCDKCLKHGLGFYSTYITPVDYIEGKRNSDIWIIGLNPKGEIKNSENPEQRTIKDFENFRPTSHSYFKDFNKVSQNLYNNFNSIDSRVAHTDLVKCFSQSFPPVVIKDGQQTIIDISQVIENCKGHLMSQIKQFKPKLILCNGSPVSREILKMFPPLTEENWNTITSYQTSYNFDNIEHKFWIVLSGFIGRIDDRNKRRLGKEIEHILEQENIRL
jgi:uracil-DNA glycosylase